MLIAVDRTVQRADGHWLCMLCPAIIRSREPHRPHGAGRAHDTCIRRLSRAMAPSSKPILRWRRPYDSLKPTQKRERRKQLRAAVTEAQERVGCPLEAIQPQPRVTPEELLHFTTAERERIRTVPSLRIPCERTIIECKKLLATTHATETGKSWRRWRRLWREGASAASCLGR